MRDDGDLHAGVGEQEAAHHATSSTRNAPTPAAGQRSDDGEEPKRHARLVKKLTEAVTALTNQEPLRALSLLLAAWRISRDPRLAERIEALSERLIDGQPPPFNPSAKNPRQEWLELAAKRDDGTVPWLLSRFEHKRDDVTEENIVAMTKWPADPRIASAACRAVQEYSGKNGRRNGPRLLTLLTAMGDPRFIEPLRPVARKQGDLGRSIGAQVRATVAALEAVVVSPVPKAQLEALDAALRSLRGSTAKAVMASLDPLFAAVYADPASDEARLVLADALQEQGFPRGEFIALQVQRGASGKPSAKETRLLKRWGDEWLGAWAPHRFGSLSDEPDFSRGFLRSADFRASDAPLSPAWATVEELRVENDEEDDVPLALLASETFAALRRVAHVPLQWLVACVAKRPLAWTDVEAFGDARTLSRLSKQSQRLASLETFIVHLDREELTAGATVLFGPAWRHVKRLAVLGGVDLALANDLLEVSVTANTQQADLAEVAQLLGTVLRGRVRRVVLITTGELHPQGLYVGRWLAVAPLAEAVRAQGATLFLRRLSSMTWKPLGADTELVLERTPSSLDGRVAQLEKYVERLDFWRALEALRELVEADPKRETHGRVTALFSKAALQKVVDADQRMALNTIPLVLSEWR